MGRKILVDTSVINDINRGNAGAARALQEMMRGGEVYLSEQAYKELMQGGTPRDQAAMKETLRELKLSVAPPGDPNRRADFYQWNVVDKQGGKQARIQDGARWDPPPTEPSAEPIRPLTDTHGIGNLRDAGVAAQAYGLDAEIFSADGTFANANPARTKEFARFGLKVAPESTSVKGGAKTNVADYNVGRGLLGLDELLIDPTGTNVQRIRRGGGSGGGGGPGGEGSTSVSSGSAVTALDVAGAHMIIRNGLTQISMQEAGNAAMAAYVRKKPEIERLREQNPAYGVRIDVYFQFQPGVNADFNDTYRFEQLTVSSMASGLQGVVVEMMPRGQLQVFSGYLPALRPDLKPLQPAAAPNDPWYQRYLLCRRGVEPPAPYPYTESFNILNGSAMYDILHILNTLVKDGLFNLLENILPSVPGIYTARLKAAFGAVRASWGGGNAFANYKEAYAKEFFALPADQQKNIEDFMKGGLSGAEKDILGRWKAQVHKWTWMYLFTGGGNGGSCRWTDPFNGQTGLGSWKLAGDRIKIAWQGSKTTEEWYLPVNLTNQTGKCFMEEGTYPLAAVKQVG
jgi:hypothetical protein